MEQIILDLLKVIDDAAYKCDQWAQESRNGGWSTHQVESNKRLAEYLRQQAAMAKAGLYDLEHKQGK